jgi:hypothetical protein
MQLANNGATWLWLSLNWLERTPLSEAAGKHKLSSRAAFARDLQFPLRFEHLFLFWFDLKGRGLKAAP